MAYRFLSYCFIFFLVLVSENAFSQPSKPDTTNRKTRKIEILNADSLLFDQHKDKESRRLLGHVRLKHDDALMFCDSAHVFDNNSMNAYGNVHIFQGDSLNLYGDRLFYDGNTRMARMRKHVRLNNNDALLTTDSLDYNRNTESGHYYNFGTITQSENVLTSKNGFYYSKTKDYFSIDSVVLVNPDYTMFCDTLQYNTKSEIAYFHGPTKIVSDSNFIYCENGFYNTVTNISQYKKNAYLKNNTQMLKGDSLYYDRNKKIGRAFHNVTMVDSTEDISLRGHYAIFYEETEMSVLTDSAIFIKYSDNDTLYLHADTLRSIPDTAGNKTMKAYHHVKIFKNDFQAMCDSMVYAFSDSIIKLYFEPILWSDDNQMSADSIEIHTKNDELEYLEMNNVALMISKEDTTGFNQIKGNKMIGTFTDGELSMIKVIGDGETIYFPKEDDDVIGLNDTKCVNMTIHIKENEFQKIVFLSQPKAKLSPVKDVSQTDKLLPNFKWLDYQRPLNKDDIFKWIKK